MTYVTLENGIVTGYFKAKEKGVVHKKLFYLISLFYRDIGRNSKIYAYSKVEQRTKVVI